MVRTCPCVKLFEMSGHVITIMFIVLTAPQALLAQDRGIEFLSGPEFKLSARAIAAGIDGTLTVYFKVDRTGNVRNLSILAGPIWPCDSRPGSVIKEVREAVRQNILASKFSPAIEKGKPVDADATLDFAIGIAYQEAIKGKSNPKSRWVVDVNTLGQTALRLPKPMYTGFPGVATVRVLISESGEVISAGTVRGHPRLHATSRMAACEAQFPPTLVEGKPIKVTGLITYEYTRWSVTVR